MPISIVVVSDRPSACPVETDSASRWMAPLLLNLAVLKARNLSLCVEGPLVAEYERTLVLPDDAHA